MALNDAETEVDTAFTRKQRRGPSYENVFAGAPSFLRRSYSKDLTGVDLAITGAPFDQAVTNRPGTRLGPRAVREASLLQPIDMPFGWGFDPISDFDIIDYGDLAFDYANTQRFPAALQAHIAGILDAGAGSLMLGGDHYVTLPALRAHAARFGPLGLIQFDAHSDSWPDDDPDRIDHGTFVYKAIREGIVDPARSVQIGIRTVNDDPLGVHTITAAELHQKGTDWAAGEIRRIAQGNCYLTFDIDALDPAFAPGTGTPVWGGLASWQAAAILRGIAGVTLTGADMVEVSPPFDPAGATAIAGAHVAVDLMCLYCWTRRND